LPVLLKEGVEWLGFDVGIRKDDLVTKKKLHKNHVDLPFPSC